MKKLFKFLWALLRILYFPIYLVFFIFYKVLRLLLAFAFAGLLEFKLAKDTIKFLFIKPTDYEK